MIITLLTLQYRFLTFNPSHSISSRYLPYSFAAAQCIPQAVAVLNLTSYFVMPISNFHLCLSKTNSPFFHTIQGLKLPWLYKIS